MEHMNLQFFFNLEKEGKKSVIDFCMKMGFIANSYECPDCKQPMKLASKIENFHDGFVWCCRHNHVIRRTIRSGSWFEESRLSMIQMLNLAYLWVKKTTHIWIADELKMSQNTVSEWMTFFRQVCVNAIMKEGIFIGGPNVIVEIDAKCFSRIQNRLGQDIWVFGGVERTTKKCFLEVICNGEEDEIISILKKYVLPETTIISDNWSGFDCLESNGYVHQKLKCSGFKDSNTGAHKNNILCLWSTVKKIFAKRIVNDQFGGYLAEIMWRRIHKEDTQGQLMSFFKILCQIFTPRVRDDFTYISRKTVMENKRNDSVKTQSKEVLTDIHEREMTSSSSSSSSSDSDEEKSGEVPDSMVEREETQLKELEGNNKEGQEDKLETENGSQRKRQKTMDSLDT